MIINFIYTQSELVSNCTLFIEELRKKYKQRYVKKTIPVDGIEKEVVCVPGVTALNYTNTIYQYAKISMKDQPELVFTKEEFQNQTYLYDLILKDNMVIINHRDYPIVKYYSSTDITRNVKLDLDNEKDRDVLLEYFNKYFKHDVNTIKDLSSMSYTSSVFQEETRFVVNHKEIKVKDIYESDDYIFARHHTDILILNKKLQIQD